jgi:hypothetical protein
MARRAVSRICGSDSPGGAAAPRASLGARGARGEREARAPDGKIIPFRGNFQCINQNTSSGNNVNARPELRRIPVLGCDGWPILQEGILQGQYLAVSIYAVCLLIAFAAFFNIFINMIFTGDDTLEYKRLASDRTNILPIIIAFAFTIGTSLYFGGYLTVIIQRAASIINT